MFSSRYSRLPARFCANAALLLLTLCVTASAVNAAPVTTVHPMTTVYIVRHAEKLLEGKDPGLSEAGVARAEALAHVLQDAGIDVVFTTNYARTRQTAMPLAALLNLPIQTYAAGDAQGLATLITTHHAGQQILVLGHSNTVGRIAAALGADGLGDLTEDQYDRLLVVHHWDDDAQLEILRYGAKTP